MTKPAPEFEALVEALRADVPSTADRERVRRRLLACGVAVSASVTASGTAAAGIGGSASGSAAGVGAKAGLLTPLAGLSLAAKVGVASAVVAVSVAMPIMTARQHGSNAHRTQTTIAASSSHASRSGVSRTAAAVIAEPAPVPRANARAAASPPAEVSSAAMPMLAAPTTPVVARSTRVRARAAAAGAPAPRSAEPPLAAAARAIPQSASEDSTATTASDVSTSQPPIALASLPAASALREEAELLERALSALRSGDRARARDALASHARRFAHGALEHERERIERRIDSAPTDLTPAREEQLR
jgi:hypothetical protein